MNFTKMMFSMVMDGIKDTDMIIEYAMCARRAGRQDMVEWFRTRAEHRMGMLKEDYARVNEATNLERKADQGDEMADAFRDHLHEQMEMLERKLNML